MLLYKTIGSHFNGWIDEWCLFDKPFLFDENFENNSKSLFQPVAQNKDVVVSPGMQQPLAYHGQTWQVCLFLQFIHSYF